MIRFSVFQVEKKQELWFADNGVILRRKILDTISKNDGVKQVIVDLKDIKVADSSYLREAFVQLINTLSLLPDAPQVLFSNVDQNLAENLELSLKTHKLFTLITSSNGQWKLIGKYSPQTYETVEALIKKEEATARQLSASLGGINLTTCNNRLMALNEMCVAARTEVGQKTGGVEFVYRTVV